MGTSHCICGERPCICFNGWGTHFKSNDELLSAIDEEVERSAQAAGYTGDVWERRRAPVGGVCEPVYEEEIASLWLEGMRPGEIAEELGEPLWLVELVIKREKRKEKRRQARWG